MNKRLLLILGAAVVLPICLIVICGVVYYLAAPLVIDRTVDEAFPLDVPSEAEMAAMSPAELATVETELMATAAAMPDQVMDEADPAGSGQLPTLLRSGSFSGADDFHQGQGLATIYQLPDGRHILRLEEFSVTNGPDLHVLLATSAAPTGRDDLGEYVDLGPLKGNVGNQNYDLPAGLDLSLYNSVVIYCVPFHVLFASAPLGG